MFTNAILTEKIRKKEKDCKIFLQQQWLERKAVWLFLKASPGVQAKAALAGVKGPLDYEGYFKPPGQNPHSKPTWKIGLIFILFFYFCWQEDIFTVGKRVKFMFAIVFLLITQWYEGLSVQEQISILSKAINIPSSILKAANTSEDPWSVYLLLYPPFWNSVSHQWATAHPQRQHVRKWSCHDLSSSECFYLQELKFRFHLDSMKHRVCAAQVRRLCVYTSFLVVPWIWPLTLCPQERMGVRGKKRSWWN